MPVRWAVFAAFSTGVLVASLFLWTEARYEDRVFDGIVRQYAPSGSDTERAIALNEAAHEILDRPSVRGDDFVLRERLGRSLSFLVDARACGGYSLVLARLLQHAGVESRIAHMRCDDVWGCHIVVEARTEDGWIALDPLFGHHFVAADSSPASAAEVGAQWAYFREQVPAEYNPEYDYGSLRYTNWSRLPGVRSVLSLVIEDTDTLSIRVWALNVPRIQLYALLVGYLVAAGPFVGYERVRRRRHAAQSSEPDDLAPPSARQETSTT